MVKIVHLQGYRDTEDYIKREYDALQRQFPASQLWNATERVQQHIDHLHKYVVFLEYLLAKVDNRNSSAGEQLLLQKMASDLRGVYGCLMYNSLPQAVSIARFVLETNLYVRFIYLPCTADAQTDDVAAEWLNRSSDERNLEMVKRLTLYYDMRHVEHYRMWLSGSISPDEEDIRKIKSGLKDFVFSVAFRETGYMKKSFWDTEALHENAEHKVYAEIEKKKHWDWYKLLGIGSARHLAEKVGLEGEYHQYALFSTFVHGSSAMGGVVGKPYNEDNLAWLLRKIMVYLDDSISYMFYENGIFDDPYNVYHHFIGISAQLIEEYEGFLEVK